jgi:hypothetical protein
MNYRYEASKLLPGDGEFLREHAFTRWMTRDLRQAAVDFLKHLRLLPIYGECSAEDMHRYLCWNPPVESLCEVRTGRTLEQFEKFDAGNLARGWLLLSLHINERDIYSAVWISPAHYVAAVKVLAGYGITPANRVPPA